MFHARPHLETHSRPDNHSAVAGAAYRLGLKLVDRRLQRTFDFRKRVEGDEVVFQTTVAPPGAPSWATDPGELWNRVEQAERRKDAQVARDYRVPLPLGLSDADVVAMAIEIAQFIAQRLTTPVSIGVHRDAPITAFGEAKTGQQVGCHAHLYFPSRKILLETDDRDAQAGGSGFGEKLGFLSNKSTSGFFVEAVNEVWAKTANWYTARVGLTADYDHRSYRRMGLKVRPQPRLGEAATALERSGHATRRGDAVREARAMGEVYRRVHQARQAAIPSTVTPLIEAASGAPRPRAPAPGGTNVPPRRPAETATPDPSRASLSERFRQLYFAGLEEGGGRPSETLVFRLVLLIEQSMGHLRHFGRLLWENLTETQTAQSARLDALAALDEWRQEKRDDELTEYAFKQKSRWERVINGVNAWMDAPDPIEVKRQAEEHARVDRQLATRVEVTSAKVTDLETEAEPWRKAAMLERARLKQSLRDLAQAHEAALPQLLAVAWEEERVWLEKYMPELLRPDRSTVLPSTARSGRGGPRMTPRVPRNRV